LLPNDWQKTASEKMRERTGELFKHTQQAKAVLMSFPLLYLLSLSQDQEGKRKMNTGEGWSSLRHSGSSMVSTVYPLPVLL